MTFIFYLINNNTAVTSDTGFLNLHIGCKEWNDSTFTNNSNHMDSYHKLKADYVLDAAAVIRMITIQESLRKVGTENVKPVPKFRK